MADSASQASECSNKVSGKNTTQANNQLFLDALDVGVTGTVVVMICRKWDVNATSGRYISTDFIVSDAKVNYALLCLQVNQIVTIKNAA